MMTLTKRALPRRTVLRGLGASIALPLLDSMVPALTALSRTPARPVPRLAAIYAPMGMNMADWTPPSEGPLELSPILQPLGAFRDRLLVVSGLESEEATGNDNGVHPRCQTTWLTGARAKKTEGADMRAGISMDQIAARQFGKDTQLASLELALEAVDTMNGGCGFFGYGCAYLNTISWRSPTTPLPMEVNPRAVFERLFGDNDTTDQRARLAAIRSDRSVLDAVSDKVARLQPRLGPHDRVKLAEYLDAVRDVERRIQKADEQAGQELLVAERPMGIPATFEEHIKLMFDLLLLAYQTDLTRVSTFLLGREGSLRTFPEIGVRDSWHPLSHHQDNPGQLAKQGKLNTYHVQMLAHFLEKLRATSVGDGSLLDHTTILYGSGMSNSNLHLPSDVPTLVVAGSSSRIAGGRHVQCPKGTPLANLQLTILDRIGVHVDHFGDSTGELNLLSI